MKKQIHERARELVTLSSVEGISEADSMWLQKHMAECEECTQYAKSAAMARDVLHSISFKVDTGLVAATQMRTRMRAQELREREQKLIPIWISCVVALVVAAVSAPYLWQGFEWIGASAHWPSSVWQTGFVLFWVTPAVLAFALVLMVKGSGSGMRAE